MSPVPSLPRDRRRALTLLELIVVIVVLAVLALVAVPSYLHVISRATVSRDATSLDGFATDALSIAHSADSPTTLPDNAAITAAADEMTPLPGPTAWTVVFSSQATPAPSETYGTVSADDTDSTSDVGMAMMTQNGDCVMALVSQGDVTTWDYDASLGSNCDGLVALEGPGQTTPEFSIGPPGTPQNPSAAAGASAILVSWTPNTGPGYGTATSFTATASGGATCTTSGDSCTISGLTPGTTYTVTITASNSSGTSPATSPVGPVTPYTTPDAPTGATASGGPDPLAATVSWVAPAGDGGSPITDYAVTASDSTDAARGGETCTSAATSCEVTGLTSGDTYVFSVVAENAAGASSPDQTSSFTLAQSSPAAPTGLSAASSPNSYDVTLSWSAPSDGGSAITGYALEISSTGTSGPWTTLSANTNSTATTYSYTAPNSNTFYWRAAAINGVGQGPWSAADTVSWGQVTTGYSCPSGYTRSGSTCTETTSQPATLGTPPYQCPTTGGPWTQSGSGPSTTCSETSSYAATGTTTYSCPSGYAYDSGSGECSQVVGPAQGSYSCPGGGTLSGTSCQQSTWQTDGPPSYSCPSGYTLSGTTCTNKLGQQTSASASCPSGESLSGGECGQEVTSSYPATETFNCNVSGGTLSGSTCYNYASPTTSTTYSCPSGGTLSGSKCTQTTTVPASPNYTCPSGYQQSGTTCTGTVSQPATPVKQNEFVG